MSEVGVVVVVGVSSSGRVCGVGAVIMGVSSGGRVSGVCVVVVVVTG